MASSHFWTETHAQKALWSNMLLNSVAVGTTIVITVAYDRIMAKKKRQPTLVELFILWTVTMFLSYFLLYLLFGFHL